jgi:hypothetical protein
MGIAFCQQSAHLLTGSLDRFAAQVDLPLFAARTVVYVAYVSLSDLNGAILSELFGVSCPYPHLAQTRTAAHAAGLLMVR